MTTLEAEIHRKLIYFFSVVGGFGCSPSKRYRGSNPVFVADAHPSSFGGNCRPAGPPDGKRVFDGELSASRGGEDALAAESILRAHSPRIEINR